MSPVFKKLNLKDQKRIVVVNAPGSFENELDSLEGVQILRSAKGAKDLEFFLAFVERPAEVEAAAKAAAASTKGDAVVWLAYPKQSSEKYKIEINRDSGWKPMGEAGFEPVRMVAIDEDWSAKRFRRVEFIKTMTRDVEHRISTSG